MQEIMRGYHRKGGNPRAALKIDIMKAYDTVDWNFLLTILQLMDFPEDFILWVCNSITTPRFSISLNGALVGLF